MEGMNAEPESGDAVPVELLHPFYLDTDMSMAFAAALSGGVALQSEEVEGDRSESAAIRKLQGNVRLFGALGASGQRDQTEEKSANSELRLVRQHTEASIFISLYDELRRTGRLREGGDISTFKPGQLVSLEIGPAVAPLRRLVDQLLRLLDVAEPLGVDEGPAPGAGATRQQKREHARQAAKRATADDNDPASLSAVRNLLTALRDDLDRSGMIDVVVRREDGPSVVLTLDKRLVSDQAIELLHTSRFTVIGKVTEIWRTEEEVANLYRRSVISLVPALTQTVAWSMFTMVAGVARALDPREAEQAARQAIGVEAVEEDHGDSGSDSDPEPRSDDDPGSDSGSEASGTTVETEAASDDEELYLGDAVLALSPAVNGPAVQILPLAVCA